MSISLEGFSQESDDFKIDLTNWKLEVPSGYKADQWKLENFRNDRFLKPFFYLDSLDGALVMDAYPVEGKSSAKYTRNVLREQNAEDKNATEWTMEKGAVITADFQVVSMSMIDGKKYDRTLLFQIDGKTTDEQNKKLGLTESESLPMLKIYWQDEILVVQRKVLKDLNTVGEELYKTDSWTDDKKRFSNAKIGFNRTKLKIVITEKMISVQINEEKPILYKDLSVKQWYFENYLSAGNYLQSKEPSAHSVVKFYELSVSH
jgi:hypothetical protein